ncbi:hypothetical protein ACWGQT_16020, partial [Streptomyces yangpuensis]
MLYPLSYECLGFPGFFAPLALREQQYMDLAGTRNPLAKPQLTCGNAPDEDRPYEVAQGTDSGRATLATGRNTPAGAETPERIEAPVLT